MIVDDVDAARDFCYLITTGRTTGLPREIEIWFAADGGSLYLLAGGGENAHWVRNIRASSRVRVRLGDRTCEAIGRLVRPATAEDALTRRLLLAKYQPGYSGDLSGWARTALPVAVDLASEVPR